MRKEILEHFKKVDKALFKAIDPDTKIFSLDRSKRTPKQCFVSLCKSIVGQQLSGKAARSIYERFEHLFPRKNVTARHLVTFTEHDLRNVGMSYAKARALLDYADKVLNKQVSFRNIEQKTNEEISDMLLQIKGVGPWTVEMFLMFSLGREDIFSPKDLGLQKGIQKIYNLKKRPNEKEALEYSHKWEPYRTYASLVLWHQADS